MSLKDIKKPDEQKRLLQSIVSLQNTQEFNQFVSYLETREDVLNKELRTADGNFRQCQGQAKEIHSLLTLIGSARSDLTRIVDTDKNHSHQAS